MSTSRPRFDRVSAILFDFDGTLVDASEAIWSAFETILRRHGESIPDPSWMRRRIGRPLSQIFVEAMGPMDESTIDALTTDYRTVFFQHAGSVRLLPGAAETVRHFAAHHIPLAIATSRTAAGARLLLDALGLHGFGAIVGIDDIEHPKPDPEPLHRALQLLGVSSSASALMVGDTPDDVLAARRGGLGAIAVASGGHDRADLLACGPDAVLDRLDELIDLVAAD